MCLISHASLSGILLAIPEFFVTNQHELWYYIAGAAIFLIVGFVTGYFVWRRSHLQFVEMRLERKHATEALERFSDEIERERRMLEDAGPEPEVKVVSGRKKKNKKKGPEPAEVADEAPVSVAEMLSNDPTVAVEPPENPVAKAMRQDGNKLPNTIAESVKPEDDLGF